MGLAKRKLRLHQRREMLDYCLQVDNPALFVEMRLGKTLVTIRRCASYPPGPRLVVAPNSALAGWKKDLALDGFDYLDMSSSSKKRRKLPMHLTPDASLWVLTNRESHIALPSLREQPWQAVILDESTFIKSPTAKVTRFYVDGFSHVPHRWILAGRPAPEGTHEYFEQLRFIGVDPLNGHWSPGARGFYEFRAKHMTQLPHGGWVMRTGSKRALEMQVAQVALVLRREDVGLADQKVYETREVYLKKSTYKTYAKAETEFLLEDSDGVCQDTRWAVVRYHWLRQMAGGHIQKQLVDSAKIDEVISLLKHELSGERIVIMCNYDPEVKILYEVLGQRGYATFFLSGAVKPATRDLRIHAWAREKGSSVLICQQAVAQMGMDLSAADTMIYYSRPAGGLPNSQTEDRIVSLEKTGRPLLYIDLVARDTIDEETIEMVNDKESEQDLSLSFIQKLRQAMLKRRQRKGKR